jgi:hypothetical protein
VLKNVEFGCGSLVVAKPWLILMIGEHQDYLYMAMPFPMGIKLSK